MRETTDDRGTVPGFAKVKEYREVAAMKVLSVDDPWEMTLPTTRSGFSEEADAFLVLFVGNEGELRERWC